MSQVLKSKICASNKPNTKSEMRNMEFASWLAGFVLICEPTDLSPTQIKCIESHAKLCEYTEKGRLTITNHMIRYMLHEVSIENTRPDAV